MKKVILSVAIAVASMSASAVELNVDEKYLTGNIGLTSYDASGYDSTIGFGIGIGAPIKGLDINEKAELLVEVGYNYLGESSYKEPGIDATLTSSAIYGLAKLNYEVKDNISIYGKAGLGYIMTTADVTVDFGFGSVSDSADDSDLKLVYGGGAQYKVSEKMSIGAEYVFFSSDISSLSGVVNYNF